MDAFDLVKKENGGWGRVVFIRDRICSPKSFA